ncbi:MAG: methyltransferase domain-containing protein [Pirellulales bacterium]|nr:methyltransferase domain-containing protein [Pirellulales bacterium]
MPGLGSGYGLFFKEFICNFHTTGAVLPSGPWLCGALARYVGEGDAPKQVLEVGPGTGAVTRHIVPRLGEEDSLDLVELNASFVKRLRYDFEHDSILQPASRRVEVHQVPIEDLAHDRRFDVIVSGLPLNNFSAELVERILDTFTCLLKPGGTLSFFEYIAVRRMKALVSRSDERRRLRQIDGILSSMLDAHEIRRECIVANVLPAWVHHVRLTQ